jgi:GH15 family glucan-1,4-alpha-glucosidase
MTMRLHCLPRFDYARDEGHARSSGTGIMFETATVHLRLHGSVALSLEAGAAVATFELAAGETADFTLDAGDLPPLSSDDIDEALETTLQYWREWAGRSTYRGRWRETVTRSALLLKLLTSREHGSIIAAPTFGLPESPGGERNWDYRAVWIRDASFTVYAFIRLGYRQEAADFMHWIGERAAESEDGSMRIMRVPCVSETRPTSRSSSTSTANFSTASICTTNTAKPSAIAAGTTC